MIAPRIIGQTAAIVNERAVIFQIKTVTRGDIHLTDGTNTVRVLGEGLLTHSKDDVAFVVYLNNFYFIDDSGSKKIEDMALKDAIVESIKLYFTNRGMKVDFE